MHSKRILVGAAMLAVVALGAGAMLTAGGTPHLDAEKIAQAAGSKSTTTKDGVVRLGWPRTDVKVTVDGMPFPPAAGLGSWAALTPAAHGAMLMGDTVVFQDEVTPARDAAFTHGLEVTALHNHFEVQGGAVKMTIGRTGTMHGVKVGGSMGLTTWAAFTGTDELAAADGDFIMTAADVQPVLRALRRAGIHIVALHNHMAGEQPAFYFTHFWGKGPAGELARGLTSALDAQAAAGPGH